MAKETQANGKGVKTAKPRGLRTGEPCIQCMNPSDNCHVRSRGSGGGNEEWNLIALCRWHHIEQHKIGWVRFSNRYPAVAARLARQGWVVENRFGVLKLVRNSDGFTGDSK